MKVQSTTLKSITMLGAFCVAIIMYSPLANAVTQVGGFCDCTTSGDEICHIPPGNSGNMHTIRVGDPAIKAHLAHGDTLGPCPGEDDNENEAYEEQEKVANEEAGERACTCANGEEGVWYHSTPSSAVINSRSVHGQ